MASKTPLEKLQTKATGLGVAFTDETTLEELTELVSTAEEAKKEADRLAKEEAAKKDNKVTKAKLLDKVNHDGVEYAKDSEVEGPVAEALVASGLAEVVK